MSARKTYTVMVYTQGARWSLASGLSSREAADRAMIAALPTLPAMRGTDGRPVLGATLGVEEEAS